MNYSLMNKTLIRELIKKEDVFTYYHHNVANLKSNINYGGKRNFTFAYCITSEDVLYPSDKRDITKKEFYINFYISITHPKDPFSKKKGIRYLKKVVQLPLVQYINTITDNRCNFKIAKIRDISDILENVAIKFENYFAIEADNSFEYKEYRTTFMLDVASYFMGIRVEYENS